MKKILFLFSFLFSLNLIAQENTITNNYSDYFEAAYQANPAIPRGLLEAVAFTTTRIQHINADAPESCVGLPRTYGVMGLTLDGKNYFRNNLLLISSLSGIAAEEIIAEPAANIMAYAKAYSSLKQQRNISSMRAEEQVEIISALSELPDNDLQTNFALNAHVYSVLNVLSSAELAEKLGFPAYEIDFNATFGKNNFKILSSPHVIITEDVIRDTEGNEYKKGNSLVPPEKSANYAPALWNAAASCNYGTGRSASISAVAIHSVEGSYAGCISWFQNCAANVSAHYVVRSSDGQITQMVLEANTAYHVGGHNHYTIGIEHEGYANQTGWWTNALYTASANLVKDICNSGYGINPTTCYNGPACNCQQTLSTGIKIKGHQHYSITNGKVDPGPYWNWGTYYSLVNNSTPPPPPTAPANDNCSAATTLTSNTSCTNTSGTLLNATASGLAKASCDASSSSTLKDVWYKFTAVATTQTIKLTPSSGLDGVLALYASCSGTQLGCSDNGGGGGGVETIVKSGLTVGTTYYVRVYSYGPNAPSTYTFNICVTGTPPGSNSTIQVGTGTSAYSAHPFSTAYMDERTQYIITKTELVAAGWNSSQPYLKSLGINITSAAAQSMNGFTITVAHTTSSTFASTSFIAGSNTTTVYSGTATATAGWKTFNFTTPFAYNGTNNLIITICFNNSSYSANSAVQSYSYGSFVSLYYRADLASGSVCSQTTGTQSYYRPNLKLSFYSTSNKTDETEGGEIELLPESEESFVSFFPNPTTGDLTLTLQTPKEQDVEIQGFNETGQLVYSSVEGKINGLMNKQIELGNLASGLYYFSVRTGEVVVHKKVVVKK